MPTTTRAKAPVKRKTQKPTKKQARMQQPDPVATRLADLSTLKRPKREHEANISLFDDTKLLREDVVQRLAVMDGTFSDEDARIRHELKDKARKSSVWTYHEVAQLQFIRELVQRGTFTDFPGQRHHDGARNLFNYDTVGSSEPE